MWNVQCPPPPSHRPPTYKTLMIWGRFLFCWVSQKCTRCLTDDSSPAAKTSDCAWQGAHAPHWPQMLYRWAPSSSCSKCREGQAVSGIRESWQGVSTLGVRAKADWQKQCGCLMLIGALACHSLPALLCKSPVQTQTQFLSPNSTRNYQADELLLCGKGCLSF